MAGAILEGSDERQIELFMASEELLRSSRRLDLREPGRTALLDRFDGGEAPLLGPQCLLFAFGRSGDYAFRNERNDPKGSQLSGLLDDGFEKPAFRQRLDQSDFPSRRLSQASLDEGQFNFVAVILFDRAEKLCAGAVQDGDAIAAAQTQHARRVVSFTTGKK